MADGAAQIFNLPYRRIEFCAVPVENRRYGRVQLGATSTLLESGFKNTAADKLDWVGAPASWTAAVLCRFCGANPAGEKRQRAAAVQNLAELFSALAKHGRKFTGALELKRAEARAPKYAWRQKNRASLRTPCCLSGDILFHREIVVRSISISGGGLRQCGLQGAGTALLNAAVSKQPVATSLVQVGGCPNPSVRVCGLGASQFRYVRSTCGNIAVAHEKHLGIIFRSFITKKIAGVAIRKAVPIRWWLSCVFRYCQKDKR